MAQDPHAADAAHQLGAWGEARAKEFLEGIGQQVLARNLRFHPLEIDLVTLDGTELALVEVKTRRQDGPYAPETALTPAKQRALTNAAHQLVAQDPFPQYPWFSLRFDLLAIIGTPTGYQARYYPDVFRPSIDY